MKKQIKKGLSLMLAVLMVLSCWVWVAPTKAEAAGDTYKLTFYYNVTNEDDGGDEEWARIHYMPNNGTGTEEYMEITFNFSKKGEGSTTVEVPGWPTAVYAEVNKKAFNETIVEWRGLQIGDVKVVSGTWTRDNSDIEWIPNSRNGGDGKSGTVDGNAEGTWNWTKPTLDSFFTIDLNDVS